MKKRFLFTVLCLCSVASFAQSDYESMRLKAYDGGGNTIIRTYKDVRSITYFSKVYNGVQTGYFLLPNINNTSASQVSFIDGYMVRDFCIDNDTIFFCGSDNFGTVGIIGYFDISNFSATNPRYTYWVIDTVERLTKIVSYKLNGRKRHNLCIGMRRDSTEHFSCIIDADYSKINFSGLFYSFHCYRDSTNSIPQEIYYDLVALSNYVAIIGLVDTPQRSMLLRWFSYNDYTPTPYLNNTNYFDSLPIIHKTLFDIDPVTEMLSPAHATAMNGNTFAVASLCSQSALNTEFETRIRFLSFAGNAPTMIGSQSVRVEEKSEPYSLAYMPYDNSLIISQIISSECSLFKLQPYATSNYNSWHIFDYSHSYSRICSINNGEYVLGTTGQYYLSKKVTIDPTSISVEGPYDTIQFTPCYYFNKLPVKVINKLSPTTYNLFLPSRCGHHATTLTHYATRSTTIFDNECIETYTDKK
ncbi:MAG: hypothetical protein IJ684_00450 [Bacteroidales bacterium]|nr:hypothetical protein [Bacteroidales bacterium]